MMAGLRDDAGKCEDAETHRVTGRNGELRENEGERENARA